MPRVHEEQRTEELKKQIMEITQRIIVDEGVDAVSIRRVAAGLGKTAPVVYYYFRNKGHLISCAIQDGYQKILANINQPAPGLSPDERLRAFFKNFIESVMRVPCAYKSLILHFSPDLLAETVVLGEGGAEQSPTLAIIISTLEAGVEAGIFAPCDVPLTAKVCWSAMFGLFFRLVVESDIPVEEREALVERHLDIMLKGIASGETP